MTLGEFLFGPDGGERAKAPTGSRLIPVATTAGALFAGAGVLGLLSVLITDTFSETPADYQPGWVGFISALALVTGLVAFRIGDRVPFAVVRSFMLTGIVFVGLGTYFSGTSFGPFASTFFVWVSVAGGLLLNRRFNITALVLIAAAEGLVLAYQDSPSPVARWLLATGTCVVTTATVEGVMTLLHRSMRAEHDALTELEEASQHKSDFLASMSHELRTPLNAIIGFSDVLAAQHFGELNERQSGYVGDVQEAGRHLLSLINDILDLSKIESGSMELDPRTFSLTDTIDSALNLIRTRAEDERIRLIVQIDPSAREAYGDERRIKQVLANLFSNAVKFTPADGSITVQATADAETISVAVTDTGIGISTDDIARIFEDFQQVGDASTATEGTGLGLALCRRLIELHGGAITVESTPGVGSTFAFRLPQC